MCDGCDGCHGCGGCFATWQPVRDSRCAKKRNRGCTNRYAQRSTQRAGQANRNQYSGRANCLCRAMPERMIGRPGAQGSVSAAWRAKSLCGGGRSRKERNKRTRKQRIRAGASHCTGCTEAAAPRLADPVEIAVRGAGRLLWVPFSRLALPFPRSGHARGLERSMRIPVCRNCCIGRQVPFRCVKTPSRRRLSGSPTNRCVSRHVRARLPVILPT